MTVAFSESILVRLKTNWTIKFYENLKSKKCTVFASCLDSYRYMDNRKLGTRTYDTQVYL